MSEPYRLLILGGGPAGLAGARAFRELAPDGRVAIVTDEHRLPYNRPPLTKDLLRGTSGADLLPIEDEAWFERQGVDLIGGRAVSLDPAARAVGLSGGRILDYERCLLATGAEPRRPPIPGADHPRVGVMRDLDDLQRLEERLGGGEEVAVVGSGFIACEIAASLRRRGHQVTLVSSAASPNAARLGPWAARQIAGWLIDEGVTLRLGVRVEEIRHAGGRCRLMGNPLEVEADVTVLGTGVSPRVELAQAAGIRLAAGAIDVDASMRTSQDGVLAAGDVAYAANLAAGRSLRVEHWGDALGQGRVAGRVAAGVPASWDEVPGFWSTIGDHTLKYRAWGDGYDSETIIEHGGGAFTVRYGRDGRLVGVLTHQADDDYARAPAEIAESAPWKP